MPKWIVDKHFNSHMSSLQITAMKCTEVDKEGGVLAATVTCRLMTDGATEVVLHVRVDKLANFISASQHHRIARRLEAALLVTLQGGPPPSQVDATGRLEDADAVQDVIRMNYIEGGMSGMMPSPILVQGSLAAKAATQMATSRVALPGEGPARTEISPGAREVF